MSGGKWHAPAAKTHACKVSNRNQYQSEPLTMWQTLSTPFTSLTMLPTALTAHTSHGCKCEVRRRIWSKQRPNISGNNAEVQSHSHSYCHSSSRQGSVSKILTEAHSAGNPNPTRTPTATAVTATRRCRSSSRSSSNASINGSSILHSLLLLCILCGKYKNKYNKRPNQSSSNNIQ